MNDRGLTFGDDDQDEDGPPPQYSETVNVEPVAGKLKILFLAANPEGTTHLKLAEEFRNIQDRIRESEFRDRIELRTRQAVRHGDLELALLEEQPHVVHFSGHGSDRDELILQDEQGSSHRVSRKAIIALFTTLKDNVRLVVFNACFSKPQAEGIVENIAFAIGMNQAIGDEAAIQFAESLYRGIGFARTMQEAFDLGANALQRAGIAQDLTPELLRHPKADPAQTRLIQVDDAKPKEQQAEDSPVTESSGRLEVSVNESQAGRRLTPIQMLALFAVCAILAVIMLPVDRPIAYVFVSIAAAVGLFGFLGGPGHVKNRWSKFGAAVVGFIATLLVLFNFALPPAPDGIDIEGIIYLDEQPALNAVVYLLETGEADNKRLIRQEDQGHFEFRAISGLKTKVALNVDIEGPKNYKPKRVIHDLPNDDLVRVELSSLSLELTDAPPIQDVEEDLSERLANDADLRNELRKLLGITRGGDLNAEFSSLQDNFHQQSLTKPRQANLIAPGTKISGPQQEIYATVCCIVAQEEERFLLTSHPFDVGTPILSASGDEIATVVGSEGSTTTMFSLAKLRAGVAWSNTLPDGNTIVFPGALTPADLGRPVVKYGAASGRTSGLATSVDTSIDVVGFGPLQNIYSVKGQSRRFSSPGDGGAPVFIFTKLRGTVVAQLVGMIVAQSDEESFVLPLKALMDRLNVVLTYADLEPDG